MWSISFLWSVHSVCGIGIYCIYLPTLFTWQYLLLLFSLLFAAHGPIVCFCACAMFTMRFKPRYGARYVTSGLYTGWPVLAFQEAIQASLSFNSRSRYKYLYLCRDTSQLLKYRWSVLIVGRAFCSKSMHFISNVQNVLQHMITKHL